MRRSWLLLAALALPLASLAHDEHRERPRPGRHGPHAPPADSPALAAYREECGACHLAYPPGLLPARSWQELMSGLERHFGQNAELDAPTRATLARWLADNAAEALTHRKSRRVLRSVGEGTPLRLSEVPWLRDLHDEELSARVWERPAVGSRANCPACHPGAEEWSFDDERVRIPR